MNNKELEIIINKKINNENIKDYLPNGLQVEGKKDVKIIVTGVTASQELLNAACIQKADAIIVHHGFFWKKESPKIIGMMYNRLKSIIVNDINLYAWHLPLDIHPKFGNNVQLAEVLNIPIKGMLSQFVLQGEYKIPINSTKLKKILEKILGRSILHCSDNAPKNIKNVALCSGRGQNFIELAANSGMDAFITGEISEQTVHISRELGINFYAAGHHATERGGIRALGEWLTKKYNFSVTFIDIPNPA